MAPAIIGNPDRPELGEQLTNSFCRTDPDIAKAFARVTFTSDNPRGSSECDGAYADPSMPRGHYRIRGRRQLRPPEHTRSRLVLLNATGHCPNLSAPDEVIAAIRDFV